MLLFTGGSDYIPPLHTLHCSILYYAILYYVVWCGAMWSGVVWRGMVWSGDGGGCGEEEKDEDKLKEEH